MPIHLPQFQPKLACAGRIKAGVNVPMTRDGKPALDDKGRQKYYPKALDHFLITTNRKDPQTGNFIVDDEIMKALCDAPGIADGDGKIRKIPGFLHSDEIEEVFPTRLAWYDGRVARCQGDGQRAKRWKIDRGARVGDPVDRDCPCEELENGNCKAHGILRMTIALPRTITLGSLYEYRTTSVIGIPRILGGLMHIQEEIGTIVRAPIWLVLKPELVAPEGQAQKTVYVPFVHLRGDDIMSLRRSALESKRQAEEVQAVAGRRVLLGLPAPADEDEDEEEQASVSAEYKPGKDYDEATGEFYAEVVSSVPVKADTFPPPPQAVPASQLPRNTSGYVTQTEAPKPGADRLNPPGTPPPSAVSTQTEIPIVAGPAPASAAGDLTFAPKDYPDLNAPLSSLPDDAPQRTRIPGLLTKLGELRGLSDRALEIGRKEILAEITKIAAGSAVTYKALTIGQAEAVIVLLEKAIIEAHKRDTGDDRAEPVDEAPPPDDEIP
jgi:hypothetical protein